MSVPTLENKLEVVHMIKISYDRDTYFLQTRALVIFRNWIPFNGCGERKSHSAQIATQRKWISELLCLSKKSYANTTQYGCDNLDKMFHFQ